MISTKVGIDFNLLLSCAEGKTYGLLQNYICELPYFFSMLITWINGKMMPLITVGYPKNLWTKPRIVWICFSCILYTDPKNRSKITISEFRCKFDKFELSLCSRHMCKMCQGKGKKCVEWGSSHSLYIQCLIKFVCLS